jgi:hypothetical protein
MADISKATAALALLLGVTYSAPSISQTQVGVNLTNGDRLSQSAQLAALSALQAAGAKVIRIPLEPRTWGPPGVYIDSIALIKTAYASGIKPIVIVPLQYPATVKPRPYNSAYPDIWAAYPLSQSDPTIFASWFTPILAQLEVAGSFWPVSNSATKSIGLRSTAIFRFRERGTSLAIPISTATLKRKSSRPDIGHTC